MTSALAKIESYVRRCDAGEFPGDHMVRRLVRFWKRCEKGLYSIRDQHANLVPMRLNTPQCCVLAPMLDQAAAGLPIRVNVLKARKVGVSTLTESLGVDLCAYYPNQRAMTIAHEGRATQEIFEIAQRAAQTHAAKGGPPVKATSELDWPGTDSHYHAMTAGGTAVGSGGTPSFLHLSEGPKWEKNREETFTSALNAVPSVPESIVIQEFTAQGRETFYNLFSEARQTEGHPYRPVFIAWYLDDRCTAPVPDGFTPTDEEMHIRARAARMEGIELSCGQLQWRREKVAVIGEAEFRREYPSFPEEAVQASEGLIFPTMRDALVQRSELPFDPRYVPYEDRVGGIDFGYSPDPCVIWTGFYVNGHLWVTDYWREFKSLAADQAQACRVGHHYYCDPPNTSERAELGKAAKHARFSAAPRRRNPGEDLERVELKMVQRILTEQRLHICVDVAAQLIVECDTLEWNQKTGKANMVRSDACAHFDSIKGLQYMVMGVIGRGTIAKRDADRPRVLSRRQQFQRF